MFSIVIPISSSAHQKRLQCWFLLCFGWWTFYPYPGVMTLWLLVKALSARINNKYGNFTFRLVRQNFTVLQVRDSRVVSVQSMSNRRNFRIEIANYPNQKWNIFLSHTKVAAETLNVISWALLSYEAPIKDTKNALEIIKTIFPNKYSLQWLRSVLVLFIPIFFKFFINWTQCSPKRTLTPTWSYAKAFFEFSKPFIQPYTLKFLQDNSLHTLLELIKPPPLRRLQS